MARNDRNSVSPAPLPAAHARGHKPRSVAVRKAFRQLARRRRTARRRGVILLITLVLLTLFTMMLITFVVATVTSRQSITSGSRIEQTGDSPDAIMHDAFLQVIRGPRNPNSPIGAHSLLEDMLGSDSLILNAPNAVNQVTTAPTPLLQLVWAYTPPANKLPPPTGHYAGRSIMLLNGPYMGTMGRVIGSDYDGANIYLTVYGFNSAEFTTASPGQRFLINGKPFSGTGFGFKPLSFDRMATVPPALPPATYTRLLDAYWRADDGNNWILNMPQALLPNHRQGVFLGQTDLNDTSPGSVFSQYLDPAGPGGANEDYDTADFQNMALSMTTQDSNSMETILPSFHRPDLLQYWAAQVAAIPAPPSPGIAHQLLPPVLLSDSTKMDPFAISLLRKIVMRPLPWDHPNFTGSNPMMTTANAPAGLISGPWDVDNDNDGETDSVWLDIGLPVQTGADGRRYKPLVAFLIRDLDGRLNLNAHSSWRHSPSGTPTISRFLPVQAPFVQPNPATPIPIRLRVGQGYGPAEISLSPLFAPHLPSNESLTIPPYSVTYPTNEMSNLLGGKIFLDASNNPLSMIEGRYGELQLTGTIPGGGSPYPGISNMEDPYSWIQRSQHPQFRSVNPQLPYFYLPLPLGSFSTTGFSIDTTQFGAKQTDYTQPWLYSSGYGTPPDVDADGMLAFGLRGEPLYIDYTALISGVNYAGTTVQPAGFGEPNDAFDTQYEVDLSLTGRGASYNASTWSGLTYSGVQSFWPNLLTAPYTAPSDAPFTPAELERVMRANDVDATTLPERLMRLAPITISGATLNNPGDKAARLRQLVTTEQYDMATPGMALTMGFGANEIVDQIYQTSKTMTASNAIPPVADNSISTLLRARLLMENTTYYPTAYPLAAATTQGISTATKLLLPPDLLMGQKFDINRLLGNGRDDNQSGAVDEPGEYELAWQEIYGAAAQQWDLNNDGLPDGYNPTAAIYQDANGDGIFDARDMPYVDMNGNGSFDYGVDLYATLPRQLLARHLYVLMMLLKDPSFVVTVDVDGNGITGPTQLPANPSVPGFVGFAQDADTAYYIAQLAVNMVDFRDRDAIMTPFEFDIYPFRKDDASAIAPLTPNPNAGTWEVDGWFDSTGASPDDALPYRGLVWGCERPELLITETMATHDRRTRDTQQDLTGKEVDRGATPKDDDFDQVRRPLGTIIVELYNPNPPFATGNKFAGEAPNELYAPLPNLDGANNPRFGVNLSKRTAPPTAGVPISPVWRLVTLRSTAPALKPRTPTLPVTSLDRVLYFSTGAETANRYETYATAPIPRVFLGQPSGPNSGLIGPGTYGLVAPAARNTYGAAPGQLIMTPLGMRDTSGDSAMPPYANTPIAAAPTKALDTYPRLLVLSNPDNINIGVCNSSYTLLQPWPNVKPTVGIWVAPVYLDSTNNIVSFPNVGNPARSVRFSLTEPDNGYPIVKTLLNSPSTDPTQQYLYNENGFYDPTAKYPDTPYDSITGAGTYYTNGAYDVSRQTNWTNNLAVPTANYSTLPAVTTVCLQRLANPQQPWEAVANPYIIVDQMPIDLSVFNSEMQTNFAPAVTPAPSTAEFVDAGNNNIDPTLAKWTFDTRRRSVVGSPLQAANANNIWCQWSAAPGVPFPVTAAGSAAAPATTTWSDMTNAAVFTSGGGSYAGGGPGAGFMPRSTLGFLNNEYGYTGTLYGISGTNRWSAAVSPTTTTTIGGTATVNPLEYYGDPTVPFPWLNWNNRPYVSSKEMLLVPTGSPASMLREMSLNRNPLYFAGSNFYQPTITPGALPQAEFAHLPNVFDSPLTNIDGSSPQPSARLYRLFDFIHVPSRYTGTVDWVNPGNISGTSTSPHYLHPPFNQVSRFRDPGKVNINTVYDPAVWQGILDERLAADQGFNPAWLNMYQSMWASRQGAGVTNGANSIFGTGTPAFPTRSSLLIAPQAGVLPTIFAKPYRSASGNALVPLPQMRYGHVGIDTLEREISSTMFRADPVVPAFPMLEAPGAPAPASGFFKEYAYAPYATPPNPPPFANTQTSPYFAYEELRRLDNLVTTRSNVYAVWMTMGYFEVTPAPGAGTDPEYAVKYPDGWQLGAEIGSDTGDVQRHRSFYIYDRSIPVGFERGENHNVDRGILVERYIE